MLLFQRFGKAARNERGPAVTKAELRINNDIDELSYSRFNEGGSGARVNFPEGSKNLSRFTSTISLAEGLYKNASFEFMFTIPTKYPHLPPEVRCLSRIFHPNFHYRTGEVSVKILKQSWTAVKSINSVILELQRLLIDPTLDLESAITSECVEMIQKDFNRFHSTVKQTLQGGSFFGVDFAPNLFSQAFQGHKRPRSRVIGRGIRRKHHAVDANLEKKMSSLESTLPDDLQIPSSCAVARCTTWDKKMRRKLDNSPTTSTRSTVATSESPLSNRTTSSSTGAVSFSPSGTSSSLNKDVASPFSSLGGSTLDSGSSNGSVRGGPVGSGSVLGGNGPTAAGSNANSDNEEMLDVVEPERVPKMTSRCVGRSRSQIHSSYPPNSSWRQHLQRTSDVTPTKKKRLASIGGMMQDVQLGQSQVISLKERREVQSKLPGVMPLGIRPSSKHLRATHPLMQSMAQRQQVFLCQNKTIPLNSRSSHAADVGGKDVAMTSSPLFQSVTRPPENGAGSVGMEIQ